MKRILSVDLPAYVGQRVRVSGWLHALRSFGKIYFLVLRDRKGLSQIIVENTDDFARLRELQVGSVLTILGEVAANEKAQLKVELVRPEIHIDVAIKTPPSIEYVKPDIPYELDFILDHRALSLRNRKIQAVFTIQAEIAHAYRQYMHDVVGAVEYFSPNIIGASSEGGAEFFNVDYFGYTATLAQSSQLYKQVMVGVNERVFALMPFFRAEKSHTTRHLSEGKQFEFEMGFFDDWHELMDIQEGAIKAILSHIQTHCADALALLEGQLIQAPNDVSFPRLTFAEAQQIYFERTGVDERNEDDLSPAAEKELCQYALDTYGTELVFITDWKTSKRPFYSYPKPDQLELTNTFDLLCAGTEITSGGQRRHTYDSMLEGIQLKGMDPENFEDYLSIFKFGMPRHGGFGMGLERLTMTLLKLKNIREASLFPSDPKRIAGNRIKANIFYGAENIRNEIVRILKTRDIEFAHETHEAAIMPDENVLRLKALVLKGKQTKKNYQFNLPVHLKIDMKRVAELVGEKCEFETAEVIEERYGLKVGGIPPWGSLMNLETYYDSSIMKGALKVGFNVGLATESIILNPKELVQAVEPTMADFSLG
jgi:nondiscriminating aspartyl-tRNA synthetase